MSMRFTLLCYIYIALLGYALLGGMGIVLGVVGVYWFLLVRLCILEG